jgi:hypothetical protein
MCAIEMSGLFVVASPWCSSISLPSVVGTTKGAFCTKYFFIRLFFQDKING